ncbi:hypothetical protein [Mesorhizobium sp. J8]|uniref:hypothetical protein n=1 Tax=Mesorhizobium sp. J8 TaxID=2777475 RepID=UPI0019150B5D|nr:hypothetical protein [Mesorhizobium sp. J8]BCM17521.1 hypothetical protein MJ8_12870 [Mesorhizobium sp. J8]
MAGGVPSTIQVLGDKGGVLAGTTDALAKYGRSGQLQEKFGLTPSIGQKIAAIITFAGGIEYYLERALWKLHGIDSNGSKPDTDGRPSSDLIGMLEQFAGSMASGDGRTLLEVWCAAARSGFVIRHNIAHGVPTKIGETLAYMRNPRWHGEVRKREFGDFWADEYTLDLVCEAMAALLRTIATLSGEVASPMDIATPVALQALRTARSVLGEFASQDYNPSFDKY